MCIDMCVHVCQHPLGCSEDKLFHKVGFVASWAAHLGRIPTGSLCLASSSRNGSPLACCMFGTPLMRAKPKHLANQLPLWSSNWRRRGASRAQSCHDKQVLR